MPRSLLRLVLIQLPWMIPHAGLAQDLSAVLTHAVKEVTADGLLRTTRFEERFQRSGSHLWRMRILPSHRPASEHESHGREIDLSLAGQHLQRHPDGTVSLEYLRADLRTVVQVAPREWEEAGFDGSWSLAYHLVDPVPLKTLPSRPGPRPGTRWYERRGPGGTFRVLWSEPLQVALRVEQANGEGTRRSLTTLRLTKEGPVRPWEHPADWIQKDYTDLMD